MKKKTIFFVSLLLVIMCVMTGCAGGATDSQDSSIQQTDQETEDADVDSSAALNVENDTFTMEDLFSGIGADETDFLTVIGATEESETYETKLFGQKAEVTVSSSEEGTVNTITLEFTSIDPGSVLNAVAEQLGQDGETEDGVTTWTIEDNTIVLNEMESGCILEIQ